MIGGGTGTFMVITGLKKYPVHITSIISMTDSGGSNRVIRDEFGLLPTSDIRQSIVALASDNSHELLRKLFTYRYSQGTGITGMTFGNLFMAALTDIYGTQETAIEKTCEMLDVQGDILPVTYDNSHLVARYENGEQVLGEHFIDEPKDDFGEHTIIELELIPKARANPKALSAIKKADIIVLGPGDLYTSLICNLIVDGISKAIKESKGKKVLVVNLMNKFGETNGFTAKGYIETVERYIGKGGVNVALINKAKKYPKGVLLRYKEEKAKPVIDDLRSGNGLTVVRKSFVSSLVYKRVKNDKIRRSLIRHDSDKLAKALVSLL